MFAIVYKFEVKKNKETQFIESWKALTQLIYKYEGSLGSRLHQQNDNTYIAYAQWPDKNTWMNSGKKLPESASTIRAKMREACSVVETIYELECIEDLLLPIKTES